MTHPTAAALRLDCDAATRDRDWKNTLLQGAVWNALRDYRGSLPMPLVERFERALEACEAADRRVADLARQLATAERIEANREVARAAVERMAGVANG